ncbi:MAG: threonine ammonia-lyase [Halobacteriaceae archaeon]
MLGLDDVITARDRIADVVRHTPLDYSHTFSDRTGAAVHCKLEVFQRTGSFKLRGATNRIRTLSDAEREAGVVTASAGNHAQGVALAASQTGVDAVVVMPETAPISKVQATEGYGATTVLHGSDYDAAQARAQEIAREEGRTYVHAFDDEQTMAGQGTIGLEIVDDLPQVDTVVVPVGGGGLIAGIATAVTERRPDARIVGVQAAGAPSCVRALEAGERVTLDGVDTIADGIATRRVGELPFEIIRERVDEVVTVTDSEIAVALTRMLERSKTLLEGAGAVPLAAVLEERFDYADDEVVVPALCGGNVDLNVLRNLIVRGLVETGRYLRIRTTLRDRPGALQELTEVLATAQANIFAIEHDRAGKDIAMNAAEVELDLETRGPEHVEDLLAALRERGYEVEVLV